MLLILCENMNVGFPLAFMDVWPDFTYIIFRALLFSALAIIKVVSNITYPDWVDLNPFCLNHDAKTRIFFYISNTNTIKLC
jgi:hypothetical protein